MKVGVSLTLLAHQVEGIDSLVEKGKYASRSHAVRAAVQEFLEKEKREVRDDE